MRCEEISYEFQFHANVRRYQCIAQQNKDAYILNPQQPSNKLGSPKAGFEKVCPHKCTDSKASSCKFYSLTWKEAGSPLRA